MHTYIKTEEGYCIGQWCDANKPFVKLFLVPNLDTAIKAVSMLNGGDGYNIKQFAIIFEY